MAISLDLCISFLWIRNCVFTWRLNILAPTLPQKHQHNNKLQRNHIFLFYERLRLKYQGNATEVYTMNLRHCRSDNIFMNWEKLLFYYYYFARIWNTVICGGSSVEDIWSCANDAEMCSWESFCDPPHTPRMRYYLLQHKYKYANTNTNTQVYANKST